MFSLSGKRVTTLTKEIPSLPCLFVGKGDQAENIVHHTLPVEEVHSVDREVGEDVLQTMIVMGQGRGDHVRRVCIRLDLLVDHLAKESGREEGLRSRVSLPELNDPLPR